MQPCCSALDPAETAAHLGGRPAARPTAPAPLSIANGGTAISASITSTFPDPGSGFFVPAWLPPGGRGNGLDAAAWAPILDLTAHLAVRVLDALAENGVPGYAAPRSRTGPRWRLWVATSAYSRRQDVLIAQLPGLLSQAREERRRVGL